MVPRLWGVFGLVERGWRFVVVVVVLVGLLVVGVVGGVVFVRRVGVLVRRGMWWRGRWRVGVW